MHHEQRRKSKFLFMIWKITNILPLLDTVVRVFDFMCMASAMPSLNRSVMPTTNFNASFGALSIKSQRTRISPPIADKHNIAQEYSRITKEAIRDNFVNMVGRLPQITQKRNSKPVLPMMNT